MNQYEIDILQFLDQANGQIDVEKIRIACKIGNWNTALKHCLDLLLQGRVQGQKTSKGWVFWIHEKVQLKPWQEAIGILDKVENQETQTIAYLTCTVKQLIAISLPKDPSGTQKLTEFIGQKVAILRTDNPQKPVVIRIIYAAPDAEMQKSAQQRLRRCLSSASRRDEHFNLRSSLFKSWRSNFISARAMYFRVMPTSEHGAI